MRLSIVNYGLDTGADIPRYAQREDDALIKIATEIIQKHNFGTGAVVVSEVFHTGLKNSNHRVYKEKGMDTSITTFFSPHSTPFLMHHEMGGGGLFSSGDPNLLSVGSNIFAQYIRRNIETPTGQASGYGKVATFVPSNAQVNGQRAIDALRSRRLLTVSLGARVSDKDYRCSICNKSLYDEECEHTPGKEYEEGVCLAEVHNPLFREYSVVYNPSDIHAAVRRMDVMEGNGLFDKYHVIDQEPAQGYIQVYESIGRTIYPSAYCHQENDKGTYKRQYTDTDQQDTCTESALSELIAAYEKQLKDKDEIITTLSSVLKNKIHEIGELRAQEHSEVRRVFENSHDSANTIIQERETAETSNVVEHNETNREIIPGQEETTDDIITGDNEYPLSIDSLNEPVNSGPLHSNTREAVLSQIQSNNSKETSLSLMNIRGVISKRRFEGLPPPKNIGERLEARTSKTMGQRNH